MAKGWAVNSIKKCKTIYEDMDAALMGLQVWEEFIYKNKFLPVSEYRCMLDVGQCN